MPPKKPDTTGLQRAMRVVIDYLDLQMNNRPTSNLATASNTVQDELDMLIRATGNKTGYREGKNQIVS